jgi:16S rRNA (guanine1207-N2)-methyltransferase
MDRVGQIVLRNADLLKSDSILLVNPARGDCYQRLVDSGRDVEIFSQDYADHRWLLSSGAKTTFGAFPDLGKRHSQVILSQPREKERLDMMLHALSSMMHPDHTLWLAGENRTGIKSCSKWLEKYYLKVTTLDNARHCTLFSATQAVDGVVFSQERYRRKWNLESEQQEIKIVSLPGTFAHGRLDKGSSLLLEQVRTLKPVGSILDFGCGAGVIGLSLLAMDKDIDLVMLDHSALALESAQLSLQANNWTANLLASDGLSEVDSTFDWIVSNPPFHRGIRTDLDIARQFFNQASQLLSRRGKILLVCNRHLPYRAWLAEQFQYTEIIYSDNEFNVILAGKPD